MRNNVLIVNLLLRIIGGVAVIAIGAYLILHGHGTAGGWTIVGGILFGGVSVDLGGGGDE